jgi:two-component system nitrate/nitrite response regulator NarL
VWDGAGRKPHHLWLGVAVIVIQVLVAEDHARTRLRVCAALDSDPGFDVCATVEDAAAAVAAAVRELPQLCVLEVRMPGGGIEAAAEIAARLHEVKIVMLSASENDEDVLAAIRAGASGFLRNDIATDAFRRAIRDVVAGRAAVSRAVMARVFEELRDRTPMRRLAIGIGPTARLTSREWQVLDLMRYGLSTRAIADRLTLTQATVRSHISSIVRKLGAPDRRSALEAHLHARASSSVAGHALSDGFLPAEKRRRINSRRPLDAPGGTPPSESAL